MNENKQRIRRWGSCARIHAACEKLSASPTCETILLTAVRARCGPEEFEKMKVRIKAKRKEEKKEKDKKYEGAGRDREMEGTGRRGRRK